MATKKDTKPTKETAKKAKKAEVETKVVKSKTPEPTEKFIKNKKPEVASDQRGFEETAVNFDLDDDIAPVEDDGGDDEAVLEVRKKEISRAGYEKLILELKDLEDNQIPSVNNRIKEAREFGDLSENAEYQSALSEKQMLETRIAELKETIAISVVVDTNKASDTVQYGSKVTFTFIDSDESATVTIIGSAEITYEKSVTQISFDSPIGMALEGKKVGDVCKVRAEKGRFDIKITSIK